MSNPEEEVDDVLAHEPNATDSRKTIGARLLERVNEIHDNWISVPTWGQYMRALGLHTRPVQKIIERSWARRAS